MHKVEDKQEHKMTRDEALYKLSNAGYGTGTAAMFIRAIEALELIKFEKSKYIFFPHPDGKDNVSVLQSDAVKTMQQYGYEVKCIATKEQS